MKGLQHGLKKYAIKTSLPALSSKTLHYLNDWKTIVFLIKTTLSNFPRRILALNVPVCQK